MDKAILQTTPVVLSAISLQNQKALPVKLSHTFNVEISSTSFFTQKHGVKNASKTLIVAKIPFLNTEGIQFLFFTLHNIYAPTSFFVSSNR